MQPDPAKDFHIEENCMTEPVTAEEATITDEPSVNKVEDSALYVPTSPSAPEAELQEDKDDLEATPSCAPAARCR